MGAVNVKKNKTSPDDDPTPKKQQKDNAIKLYFPLSVPTPKVIHIINKLNKTSFTLAACKIQNT